MAGAFSSAFQNDYGNTNLIKDIRNPCNSCETGEVPRHFQDEGTGLDHIQCRDCGTEETDTGFDACVATWNAANPLGWGEV